MASVERLVTELPTRPPFDAAGLIDFLAARAIPGVEAVREGHYHRTLALPHGHGVAVVGVPQPPSAVCGVQVALQVEDGRDVEAALRLLRRLFDLDADPAAVDAVLGADPALAPLVASAPGRRAAGSVDPFETAVRAVIGQQVSVAGARTVAGRIVTALGEPLRLDGAPLSHVFPVPAAVRDAERAVFPMPARRAATLREVAARVDDGRLALHPGVDRGEARRRLLAVAGIGPWTADYIAMRGLGDPDVFLASDLGVRVALDQLGLPPARAERWRPWRSYAVHTLWALAGARLRARSAGDAEAT